MLVFARPLFLDTPPPSSHPVEVQPTADLWATLCQDLHGRRQQVRQEEYARVAEEFIQSARQILRPGSPRLRDAFEIAGDICQEAGLIDQALSYYQQGSTEPEIEPEASGRIAAKIAQLAADRSDWAGASRHYQRALDLLDRAGDHSQHPVLLNALASAQKAAGDFPSAETSYRRAIQMALSLHGSYNPEVATYQTNLGVELTELGRFDEAEDLLLQSLAIREHCYGANHPEIAHSLTNLGVVYHSRRDLPRAGEFYQAALDIYRRFKSSQSPEVQFLQANLERVTPR
jgi:tetratricopeptide (TPR) repeat protein